MKLLSLFDGLYEITADGRLYSKRNQKYLRPSKDKYGYMYYGKRKGVKGLVICYE